MIEDYKKAQKEGERDCRRAVAAGHHPYLTALEAIAPDDTLGTEKRLGTFEIPLGQVIGTRTEGRQMAFSRSFLPLLAPDSEFATKWSRLYDIQITEGFRDPVTVYEFLHRFYVLEGNKRCSVMKYLGSRGIEAEVTRLMPKGGIDECPEVYREFLAFWDVAPLYEIDFAKPGSYARLAAYLGQDLEHRWPDGVVRYLRSAYAFFEEMFLRSGGAHLDITPSDAMLIYLGFFGDDSLLETPSSIVLDRLGKIWNELAFQAIAQGDEEASVLLVDEPKVQTKGFLSSVVNRIAQGPSRKPLRAAFIHEGRAEDSAWVRAHEEGRKEMEEHLSGVVETLAYEGCATDKAVADAIEDAVAQGAKVVFTTSPTLMPATVKEAVMYKDVRFLNCSITLPHQAVRSYYGRMYEAKFILGALAASLSRDHRLIYQAHVPVFGTVSEIDAFALGASLIDPDAQVLLSWSRRGDAGVEDMARFADWQGLPMISGNDMTAPADEPSAFGLYTIEDGRIRNLAVPVWYWGRYYELILRSMLQGAIVETFQNEDGRVELPKSLADAQAVSYWYGMSAGVVGLALSPQLKEGSRRLVELLSGSIRSGALRPLGGTIVAQDGTEIDGDRLSAAGIVSADWLCRNIQGSLPPGWKPDDAILPEHPLPASEVRV